MKINLNKQKGFLEKMNYPLVAFLFVILIGSITLFLRPIIGIADNGDFYRIISQNGVYHLNQNDPDSFNKYFIKDYGIYRYNNDIQSNVYSTQSLFIKAAVFISKLFNNNNILDIRFMSWMFLVCHGIGIYLLVKVLINNAKNYKYKFIVTSIIIIIFCDTAYLAYFNSFYGEALNISFFLLSIGILLYIIEFKKYNSFYVFMFAGVSFIFLGSKQQLAPIGFLISIIFVRIAYLAEEKKLKLFSIGLSVFFIMSSIFFYKSITEEFQYINGYHAMNRGILLYEDNPKEVMKYFNIDEQYSLLKETTFYDEVVLIDLHDDKLMKEYYKKFTTPKIVSYYITHPQTFLKIFKISLNNAYSIRPKAMGNYEKVEGKPENSKSYSFALYSTLKERIFTGNLVLFIITIGLYLYTFIFRYVQARKNDNYNVILKEEVYFYIFLVGLFQIVKSVIGAGDADLAKHVFMYNMTFDLIFIYLISIKLLKNFEK